MASSQWQVRGAQLFEWIRRCAGRLLIISHVFVLPIGGIGRCETDLKIIALEGGQSDPSTPKRTKPEPGLDFVGTADFEHLSAMAEFLTEHKLPSPFVGPTQMSVEARPISEEQKAKQHAEEYARFKKTIEDYVRTNIEDPEFAEGAGKLLTAYYNNPPFTAAGDRELPGWIQMDSHVRSEQVDGWEQLFSRSDSMPAWNATMGTLQNMDGFADLLHLPRYQDPEKRLDQLTRMRYAAAMTILSQYLEADLLRRSQFQPLGSQPATRPVESTVNDGSRVDIPEAK